MLKTDFSKNIILQYGLIYSFVRLYKKKVVFNFKLVHYINKA